MIRVGNLIQFQALSADHVAPFASDLERNVTITFNAPQRTALYLLPMASDGTFVDEDIQFLAVVDGLEDVQFYALGPFGISADSDVWFRTLDGQQVHAVIPDAETYTKITERRVRSPDLEHMEFLLQRNLERRMAPVFNELDELRREQERYAANNPREGTSGGNSPSPEPAPGAGQPAPGAPAPGGGTEGGGSV